jgi:hypothetical protein
MHANLSILQSGELEAIENDNSEINLDNYQTAEEDDLYILVSEDPKEPNLIFLKDGFYSVPSNNFRIDHINNETLIFDENQNRLYPEPFAKPGTIKSVLSYKTRRCQPGYHKECYRVHGNIICKCVPNN